MGVGRIWTKVNKLKLKPELHNGNGEGRGLSLLPRDEVCSLRLFFI